jgi:GAF domain-containing protein
VVQGALQERHDDRQAHTKSLASQIAAAVARALSGKK